MPTVVNDIHSRLNKTRVNRTFKPNSITEISKIIKFSRSHSKCISVAGGRHAMGGQQFGQGTFFIDMTDLDKVLKFDTKKGLVEVEAGIKWPSLVNYLQTHQNGPDSWAIIQKQTGADELTIGGSLSANIHGRGLKLRPIIADVESFTLVNATGEIVTCDRRENKELFRLVIGGYGLFGVIATVTLRLTRNVKLMRVVEIINVKRLINYFKKRISDGFLHGDFQFSTDRTSKDFLSTGVFSCYKPISQLIQVSNHKLLPEDWIELYTLGHCDPRKAFKRYSKYYMSTSGKVYDSNTHQLSYYPEGYHEIVDKLIGATTKATEMITEIYIPRHEIVSFMHEAADYFRKNNTKVFYGTVRLVEKDDESFLVWAKKSYMCIIFNLHVVHTGQKLEKAKQAFQFLIDLAIKRGGSYYLTYHRWTRRDQVEICYPQFVKFLKLKKKYDNGEVFQSEWYRHYKKMFADQL